MSWIQSLTKVVNNIGRNGTAPPRSGDNAFPLVWEYMLSRKLCEIVERRKAEAHRALVDAGVLQADYEPGTHVAYSTDGLSLIVKRNTDSSSLDETALRNELSKRFGAEAANELLSRCRKPRKGATIVQVVYEDAR